MIYNYVKDFGPDMNLVMVRNEKMHGFLDRSGKEVVPLVYEDIDSFYEERCLVKRDWLYGFIDKNGKEIIECKYRFATHFSDGLSCVDNDDEKGLGFIDIDGKIAIPFQNYNDEGGIYGFFEKGYALIKTMMALADDGMDIGYIDKQGNRFWED